jgi:hypothetical protein
MYTRPFHSSAIKRKKTLANRTASACGKQNWM